MATDETALIDKIEFGLFSPDELVKMSVAEINKAELYDHNQPIEGGLADPRLGTISYDYNCSTCGQDQFTCPGHFGHIKLSKPLYHIGYIDLVYKILQCVCPKCGRLLASYSEAELQRAVTHNRGKNRLLAVHALIKGRGHCEHTKTNSQQLKRTKPEQPQEEGKEQPDPVAAMADQAKNPQFWRIVSGTRDESQWVRQSHPCGSSINELEKSADGSIKKKNVRGSAELIAEDALSILSHITDQDIRILGFDPERCRPEWMILQVLPVPPPHVRPAVQMDGSHMSQDDVTKKLATIIQVNQAVAKAIATGAASTVLNDAIENLQLQITTYMINDKPSIKRATMKNGRPFKAISQRLKGKAGHIRGHLSGKRVNFSSRSVISPDPSISIDEVGVPQEIAKILTFPEVVTTRNLKEMQQLIYNGSEALDGANSVIDPHGVKFSLAAAQDATTLQIDVGYTVERHIRNGDIVIFNRQPSLHKMSMMGHRARVMPGQTFRLNLCVTTPYNADFDGDEMNMHVPQSQTARAEAKHIMLVPNQIISPQSNSPIIGLVQDSLLGCRLLSLRDTFLTRNEVTNLMMWLMDSGENIILPPPCILKPKELWSGKQVFSLFLPKINYDGKSEGQPSEEGWEVYNDTKVIVRDGNLLSGIIDKRTVAKAEGSLTHVVINSYNILKARNFLNQTQLVVNNWLESRGFSMGLTDCVGYRRTLDKVQTLLDSMKDEVAKIISTAKSGKMVVDPGFTYVGTFEKKVNTLANDVVNDCGAEVLKDSRYWNSLLQMVRSGSKGNTINISQIIASLGQQNVEGKRIRNGFKSRTLPHYVKDDYNLECRGFVEHSFLQGLNPQEFFFHAMCGRVGIIDTACKTSDTGYIQRRLIKSMESHCVKYDGTVRNSMNEIVQFIYGGDGLEPTKLESQRLELISLSDAEFEKRFVMNLNDVTFGVSQIESGVLQDIRRNANGIAGLLKAETDRLLKFRERLRTEIFPHGIDTVYLPIKISRLIETAKTNFHINEDISRSDLSPIDVITQVKKLSKQLVVVPGNDAISKEAQDNATLILRIQLFTLLASKPVIIKHRLSKRAFDWIIGEIRNRFPETIVAPGEMVGTIAGQSIGEPSTQMTLNTFHYAGVSAKDVTQGVPRLNEVMNIARHIKTPQVTIFMDDEYSHNKEYAQQLQQSLEFASLKDITKITEIFYDPNPHVQSTVEEDAVWVRDIFEAEDNAAEAVSKLSPWLLRIQLDHEVMIAKKISVLEVRNAIQALYGDKLTTICPPIQSINDLSTYVIRINMNITEQKKADVDEVQALMTIEKELFATVQLRGIEDITRVALESEFKDLVIDPETNAFSNDCKKCNDNINVLYTEGSSFRNILSFPHVNKERTFTNDIMEIQDILGIEGARSALLHEYQAIYKSVSYINYRHLMLLSDTMTHYGELRPVSRHGISKVPTGTLMRASYEKTVDIFFDAAAFGEVDCMNDVSSNIIVGKPSRVGTGICDVLLDMNNLPQPKYDSHAASENANTYVVQSPTAISPIGFKNTLGGSQDDGIMVATEYSPILDENGAYQQDYRYSEESIASPYSYEPASPNYEPASPMGTYIPASPNITRGADYTMPTGYQAPASPIYASSPYTPSSPAYPDAASPISPMYSQTTGDGEYSPDRSSYSPASPNYTTSPSPASPSYSPSVSPASPVYSPASPNYSPASPNYSPTSPNYSPASPHSYSPASPMYSPASPNYSPTSPNYSPASPNYSPASPNYSPASPLYSPASPSYSPVSPNYSASSTYGGKQNNKDRNT